MYAAEQKKQQVGGCVSQKDEVTKQESFARVRKQQERRFKLFGINSVHDCLHIVLQEELALFSGYLF